MQVEFTGTYCISLPVASQRALDSSLPRYRTLNADFSLIFSSSFPHFLPVTWCLSTVCTTKEIKWNSTTTVFFFTSQWEVSHDEGRTVVQWSKDGPSHASHPRTLLVVFVEASGQATGATAVRDYFMFYVEDTNYLDHLLLYWNRVRGVSKLKLWHLQSNLFHLYSEGSWRQVIKTHTHVETEIK